MGGIGSIAFSYWAPRFFISSSKLKVTASARLQVPLSPREAGRLAGFQQILSGAEPDNRHVAAGRASNIDRESSLLCNIPEVGKLAEPQPGSVSDLFVFAYVRDDDQDPFGLIYT